MSAVASWAVALWLLLAVYAYVGYPLVLWVLTLGRRPEPPKPPGEWPLISISLPAYNEQDSVGVALDHVLATDYPADRRQVLVVSDASTDGTDAVVAGYSDRGVELLRLEERVGKTGAENAALPHLRGDIIINTDASVWIDRTALRHLVARFEDPRVGVASGRDVSVASVARPANVGESRYVNYEMWVRRLETAVGGIVGASGCFYAIRRELHQNLVPGALSRDFATAMIARENGFSAVSVDEAVCYVPRTGSMQREYRRKVRTMARGLDTLIYKRALLNPIRYGLFAWKLFSHKLCRWLVPLLALPALAGLAVLATTTGWVRVLLISAALTLGIAWVGWRSPPDRPPSRPVALVTFVVVGHVAAIVAWYKALRGELNPIWEPTRRIA